MKKRIISFVIAIAIIISSIAISMTAFASSQLLYLNTPASANTNGSDDLEWFYYTPSESGTYSLLSYNVPKCEAYLFIKEKDPETGAKQYVQLAYAAPCSDPDYEANGHNEFQFKLTYHLEAGVTYYFACGWYLPTRTSGTYTVKLVNDFYDKNAINSIEVLNAPTLEAYANGEWRTDANNQSYYYYDINKVISNLRLKINYTNGKSTTAFGAKVIDGYSISFEDNQFYNHWYPVEDPNYNGNKLTIRVLNKTTTVNIDVIIGNRYSVKGTVVNLANQPVENAQIMIDNQNVAVTNSNGEYSFYTSSGQKSLSIITSTSIDYTSSVTVATNQNNLEPIAICNCDFNKDGYINAKDYAFIIKNFKLDDLTNKKTEYQASINFNNYQ